MITLSTKQFWDKQLKDCGKALNFDAKGLSNALNGMKFIIIGGFTYLQSLLYKGMPIIGSSYRDEMKQRNPTPAECLYAFKTIIKKMVWVKNKRMLICQSKPGDNYPTWSLWVYDRSGVYWYGLNRAYNTSGEGNVKYLADGKTIHPDFREILTPLCPVVFDKEFPYGFETKKGWTNTAKTTVYIGKQVFSIGGANVDKPLNGILGGQNFRLGLYNWNYQNEQDIAMPIRDLVISDGLDGETIQQLMK